MVRFVDMRRSQTCAKQKGLSQPAHTHGLGGKEPSTKVLFPEYGMQVRRQIRRNWEVKTTGLLLCMGCQTVHVDVHLSMLRRSRLEFGLGSVDSILIGYGIFADEIFS
jgi:hypothetical protein